MRSKSKILKDLNILYQQALNNDNISTALRIIELKARLEGLLAPSKSKNISIKELSDTELEAMIQELEAS